MAETLAYLLTWTTYGTWLHGDPRGSVDRTNAGHGMAFHPPNPAWQDASRRRMKHPEVVLADPQRELVKQAIREHCEFRQWQLIAWDCRSNHVHVLLRANDVCPERVMNELKTYATRAMRRAELIGPDKVWTRGGSTRHISSQRSLEAAMEYVRSQ